MNKLKTLKEQGIDLHGVHRSYFQHFCPDQTLNFPDFVAWCASNYSHYEHVVMDSTRSRSLFPINALVIRDSLKVPMSFTLNEVYFIEAKPN